jgi:NAD dependent epimerase/dehydratase
MTLESKSVLVTGAGGFIGSHLAELLVESGAQVRAMVRYGSTGSRGWLDTSDRVSDMDVFVGDVGDPHSVDNAVRGCDVVFHLAALIGIPYSYSAPGEYVRTNITGTMNVLQAARNHGVSRVVHTSTSEVYGTARSVPIDESHPLTGQSPYSATKIGADKLAEAYHLSFGLPVTTVRPFNTYGPRQSARAVIPATISQCLRGAEIRLGSLTPTRDFNFVGDTVAGMILAAVAPDAVGRTINLGSGREISIGDLVDLVGRIVGRDVRVVEDAQRYRPAASEVQRLLADNSLAKELLGWGPTVALEDGIARTVEWIGQNKDRFRPSHYQV